MRSSSGGRVLRRPADRSRIACEPRVGDHAADHGADRETAGERGDDDAAFALVRELADAIRGSGEVAGFVFLVFVADETVLVGEGVFERVVIFVVAGVMAVRNSSTPWSDDWMLDFDAMFASP